MQNVMSLTEVGYQSDFNGFVEVLAEDFTYAVVAYENDRKRFNKLAGCVPVRVDSRGSFLVHTTLCDVVKIHYAKWDKMFTIRKLGFEPQETPQEKLKRKQREKLDRETGEELAAKPEELPSWLAKIANTASSVDEDLGL